MALDAEAAGRWLTRWWVEAALGLVVLVGAASGLRRGDAVRAVLAVALGAALVDRIRLRLDNRSLAAAVGQIREAGVSAARRSGTGGTANAEAAGAGAGAGATGAEGRPDLGSGASTDDADDGSLDREAIADLVGATDPEELDADDVAGLVRRAKRRSRQGDLTAEEEDDVADLIREAEEEAGGDEDDERDVADLIREAEAEAEPGSDDDRSGDDRDDRDGRDGRGG